MEQIKLYDIPLTLGFFKIGKVRFNAVLYKENYQLRDHQIELTRCSNTPKIPKESGAFVHFSSDQEALYLKNFWCYRLQSYKRYGTDLRRTKEDLLKFYSKNTRKSIRVAREKMEALGQVTLEHYSNKDDILKHYSRLTTILKQTYQAQFLDLYFPSPEDITQNVHDMELFILKSGDVDVAYLLCSSRNPHILSTEYTGYLPSHKDASPGTLMKWLVLEKLIDDNHYAFIEYETGQNHHKHRFSTHASECHDRIYMRKTVGNMFKIIPWFSIVGIDKCLSLILTKLKLKDKIRQFFIRRTGT